MPETSSPEAAGVTRLRGQPNRAVTIASATMAAGFLSVAFFAPELLGGIALGAMSVLELALLGVLLVVVLVLLHVAGRSEVELGPEAIVVHRPFRTTRVPWDSLIRYQCDPTFAEMSLVFAAQGRGGRRYPSWVTVTEGPARAILSDPRSEWIPVEGRLTFRTRAPAA